jgi:glycosyltransferase involved in cell wall biosynthesis
MLPRASVILTTYNQPRLLNLVLHSYERQSCLDFEIVVSDDGSGPETREVIERHAREAPFQVHHVWQPSRGLRKSEAVNRAILQSRSDYLIFSDGDCLAPRSFVEEHLKASRPRTYIVGGHIQLTPEYTACLTPREIRAGKFERQGTAPERLELWTTHLKNLVYIAARKRRKPKFYGLNFSVDRASFYDVNGFDHTYRDCGREDSDLRNRMQLAGVGARSLWHRARVFRLHHPGHSARRGWEGVAEYYNHPDLTPEAPVGLRELAAQDAIEQLR